jgi:hypothetical protein
LFTQSHPDYLAALEAAKKEDVMPGPERWPELPAAGSKDTQDTLHLWTQIVGKTSRRRLGSIIRGTLAGPRKDIPSMVRADRSERQGSDGSEGDADAGQAEAYEPKFRKKAIGQAV